MTYEDISETLLSDTKFAACDKFALLKAISNTETESNDIAVLVAMRLDEDKWSQLTNIAASYIRSRGLFPYLVNGSQDSMSLSDLMARNLFESPTREGLFMHRSQYAVLTRLLNGESIVLSAPTSFGKSFIIEELLKSGKYKNVVIIVPTIALIEELREKVKKLHTNHKRISFSQQEPGEENIFILTQERAFDMYPLISTLPIDLLVIDEFYKMDQTLLDKEDGDRANLLNIVYRNYSSISKQVYLLGPFIDGVDGLETNRHSPTWIESKDNTTYIIRKKIVAKSSQRIETTCKVALDSGDNVMVYCSSPNTLRTLYISCLGKYAEVTTENDDLIEWINQNIGDEWYVTDALRHGVGVHHGKIPRFLAHEMIRRFADGKIKILLCTSSLIEGVNTNAKTIIIHNSQQKFSGDILTFRNISGRAGRMFKHFWGTVYYYEEPKIGEVIVSDSIGSDNADTPANILSLVDDTQLTAKQSKSVEMRRNETQIPWDILQQNKFIDIKKQEDLINALRTSTEESAILGTISTNQLTAKQLKVVFKFASILGFDNFKYAHAKERSLENSLTRLSIFINSYFAGGFRSLAKEYSFTKTIDDKAIEDAFYFLKNGMAYDFPKYIRALNRIQSYVLGRDAGELEPFANRLEYLDTSPVYIQLDELGLPLELSKKYHLNTESTDLAVHTLASQLNSLSGFERTVAMNFLNRY